MPSQYRLMKKKWYPRPHEMKHSWMMGLESGGGELSTIYPIAMYDEGLGSASAYDAHPEHVSFGATDSPNCFPDSKINMIHTELTIGMEKELIETDKVHAVKLGFMPIFMSFKSDYEAIDELTSEEIQDVLCMQKESTDRQGYPLYNGTKLSARYTASSTLNTNVPGLTTDQTIEKVAFDIDAYYDALQYKTTSGKLKNCSGGIKWVTLTKTRPIRKFRIALRSKTKRMNPYTFFGLLCIAPKTNTEYQLPKAGDTTNTDHTMWQIKSRYNEWHQNFNMEKV